MELLLGIALGGELWLGCMQEAPWRWKRCYGVIDGIVIIHMGIGVVVITAVEAMQMVFQLVVDAVFEVV